MAMSYSSECEKQIRSAVMFTPHGNVCPHGNIRMLKLKDLTNLHLQTRNLMCAVKGNHLSEILLGQDRISYTARLKKQSFFLFVLYRPSWLHIVAGGQRWAEESVLQGIAHVQLYFQTSLEPGCSLRAQLWSQFTLLSSLRHALCLCRRIF